MHLTPLICGYCEYEIRVNILELSCYQVQCVVTMRSGLHTQTNKVSHIVNMRFMVANEKAEQVQICYQYWIELLT